MLASNINNQYFMPNIAKGQNSNKILCNSPKTKSDNLHFIPNLCIKYQSPSSNNFWDILLTKFQCKIVKNCKGWLTLSKFYGIPPKVNQIIYTSSPVCVLKYQGPSLSSFWDTCILLTTGFDPNKVKLPKFSKGHNSQNFTKFVQS